MTNNQPIPDINEATRHEVDPVLALIAHRLQGHPGEEQDLVLFVSGTTISGRLVSPNEGFRVLVYPALEGVPPPVPSDERLPQYIYLQNANIVTASGNTIDSRIIRVKLSHVSAWVFGKY